MIDNDTNEEKNTPSSLLKEATSFNNYISNEDKKDVLLANDDNLAEFELKAKDIENNIRQAYLADRKLDIKLKTSWSKLIMAVFGSFIAIQLIYSIAFIFSDLGYSEQSKTKIVMLLMGSNFVEVLGLVALILKYLFSNIKPK